MSETNGKQSLNSDRIKWLERAWIELRGQFLPKARETATITIGFPSRNARSLNRKRVGECWSGWKNGEGHFISLHPCLFPDPLKVLETLLHEQIHDSLDNKHGHRGPFVKIARELGLKGRPSATFASPELAAKLKEIGKELGPIPSGDGDLTANPKKQTTRLRKYVCGCGQIIRAATDDLDITHNPCGTKFERE